MLQSLQAGHISQLDYMVTFARIMERLQRVMSHAAKLPFFSIIPTLGFKIRIIGQQAAYENMSRKKYMSIVIQMD